MKRTRDKVLDLDRILLAAVHAVDRAEIDYDTRAGLIICLDRTFDYRLNQILVDKALKFKEKGVVGIDIAGPASRKFRYSEIWGGLSQGQKTRVRPDGSRWRG